MTLENKLGITDPVELARVEERISKKRALELFENGTLDNLDAGTFDALREIHDVESGNVTLEAGKTLRDYITLYQRTAKDDQLDSVARALGIDRGLLAELMSTAITDVNINEYGRFDRLCDSADRARAKAFFEAKDGAALPSFKVGMAVLCVIDGVPFRNDFSNVAESVRACSSRSLASRRIVGLSIDGLDDWQASAIDGIQVLL